MSIFDFLKKNKNIQDPNGLNEIYYNSGKGAIKERYYMKKGKKEGLYKYYNEPYIDPLTKQNYGSTLRKVGNYINGTKEGLWRFYTHPESIFLNVAYRLYNYINGEEEGDYKEYDLMGNIIVKTIIPQLPKRMIKDPQKILEKKRLEFKLFMKIQNQEQNIKHAQDSKLLTLARAVHVDGHRVDKYAYDENWVENHDLTIKVMSHFNDAFSKKIWINNKYINIEIDKDAQRHKIYSIDQSAYIIHTYVQLNNSNEIMLCSGVKPDQKKTVILEFLHLINSLNAQKTDSDLHIKKQKMTIEQISSILGKPFSVENENKCVRFISDRNIQIIITNRGDSYTINLFPPNSVFENGNCVEEGNWA